MQKAAHPWFSSPPSSSQALRRTLLLAAVVTTFLLGRAFGWPGPEDGDPGSTDNLDSLSYTDTLGQDGTQESSIALAVAGSGGAGGHYFVTIAGQPVPLVGVSADNACHFNITGTGQCNYTNYAQRISDDLAAGLNVIRLWVNVAGLHWAAVEPTASAATKRWLLYVHHSTDRQRVYDGYQEVSTSNAYQENLSVCLGTASGSYRAQWIDSKNATLDGVVQTLQAPTPIAWTGTTSCTPGGTGAFTLPNPPHYSYDIALLISP